MNHAEKNQVGVLISPQKSNFWFSISGILILISVILTLITYFGKNPLIQYFSFYKVDFKNNFINFYSFQDTFFSFYEFWRLISPIFIHFSIIIACSQGHFQLNANKTILLFSLNRIITLLSDSIDSFIKRCLEGLDLNRKKIRENLENSHLCLLLL